MKNKFFIIAFLLTLILSNTVFATFDSTLLDIKEEPSIQMQVENNSYFKKELVSKDLENKSLTFQLQVSNNEPIEKMSGELMLVIDMSNSMEEIITDTQTRRDVVLNSAKTLVSSLLQNSTDLKIGVVSFATNPDIYKEGTIEDANLISGLDSDTQNITNAISNMQSTGPRTNLQAGLSLAKQQFSNEDNNKYIIVLSDGVPNVSFEFDNYYSTIVIENTKNELKTAKENDITTIAMLTGISNEDSTPATQEITFKQIMDEIFNSQTLDKFYYIPDADIEKTITEDILSDLKPIEKTLQQIKITDNFSQEILDNFNITYSQPNIGTVSDIVDNSLVWNIEELKTEQTATLQYTLTLKEDYDISILDKLINVTNSTKLTYMNNEQESSETCKIFLSDVPATADINLTLILQIAMSSMIILMFIIKFKSFIKSR